MVFAANPAGIAQCSDEVEEVGIVDLAYIWLVPPRVPGNLKMSNDREMGANLLGQVAPHHLTMVEVHLEKEVVAPHLVDNLMRVIGSIEKIPGHITRVDRLDHELNAVRLQGLGGPAPDYG